jgi:O-glycosyl hydrolase
LFFSENGLGLDIGRYNIGGGDNPSHKHIRRSDSIVPGYARGMDENGNFLWDWEADQNQRNIVLAALDANPKLHVEGFSNSPPWFLTVSGCSSGSADAVSDNLRPEYVDAFSRYIAEVTKHFRDNFGIAFHSYSPMNESASDYWRAMNDKQEGCHFNSGESQSRIFIAVRKALDDAGLQDVILSGPDETGIDQTITSVKRLSPEALTALGRIDTHTYQGSLRGELKALAGDLGKNLWMSEVDGGWAEEGAGNMAAGLGLARQILLDMNEMTPAAWVLWNIVDFHKDSNFIDPLGRRSEAGGKLSQDGGLWGMAMADHDAKEILLTQKYYVFGQFTRYINPGDTIIASSGTTLAAFNRKSGAIKIVAVNAGANTRHYTIDLSAFEKTGGSAKAVRTSGAFDGGEHWAEAGTIPVKNKQFKCDLAAYSVTTFVIEA